jgi:hypothetical protein
VKRRYASPSLYCQSSFNTVYQSFYVTCGKIPYEMARRAQARPRETQIRPVIPERVQFARCGSDKTCHFGLK